MCAWAGYIRTECNQPMHTSTASLPIAVLLYNGPLLCGFSVPIKGLSDELWGMQHACNVSTETVKLSALQDQLKYIYRQRRYCSAKFEVVNVWNATGSYKAVVYVHYDCGAGQPEASTLPREMKTGSSTAAERPRDPSCLSVVSFNSTIHRAQAHCWSFSISYVGFRFTNAYRCVPFSSAWPSNDINEVDPCCYQHTPWLKFVHNTWHSTSKQGISRKTHIFIPHLHSMPTLGVPVGIWT